MGFIFAGGSSLSPFHSLGGSSGETELERASLPAAALGLGTDAASGASGAWIFVAPKSSAGEGLGQNVGGILQLPEGCC